jgi:hypothetical protein
MHWYDSVFSAKMFTIVRWALYQHGITRPLVVDGGDCLQLWEVAAVAANT